MKDKNSICRKSIDEKKEFNLEGDTFKFVKKNEKDNIYLYARYHNGYLHAYEVVKPVKAKQPDGSLVFVYPSSSQFGIYGFFFPKNSPDIERYFNDPDWDKLYYETKHNTYSI